MEVTFPLTLKQVRVVPGRRQAIQRGDMSHFLIGILGFIGGAWFVMREYRRLRARYLRIGEDCRDLIADNARLRYQNRQLARQNDLEITEDDLAELARRNS